jgi:hypothetical protein
MYESSEPGVRIRQAETSANGTDPRVTQVNEQAFQSIRSRNAVGIDKPNDLVSGATPTGVPRRARTSAFARHALDRVTTRDLNRFVGGPIIDENNLAQWGAGRLYDGAGRVETGADGSGTVTTGDDQADAAETAMLIL